MLGYADDSYDRNLYPAGACDQIGSGKPAGPNGTECLFSEDQDFETFRCKSELILACVTSCMVSQLRHNVRAPTPQHSLRMPSMRSVL